jgi:hypothetical protein
MNHNFQTFCNAYKELEKKYNYTGDEIGLVGKNYSNDGPTSIKVYYQIWNELQKTEYPFLTNYDLYKQYYKDIDLVRCGNNGVALKYSYTNKNYSGYFHIKLKENFYFIEKDAFVTLPLRNLRKAISVEFDANNTDIRRYYYVYEKPQIEYILSYFRMTEDSNNIKYIEYTHNPKKIILIYKNPAFILESIKMNCNKNIIADVEGVYEKYKVLPSLFGTYFQNKKYSIYWDINRNNNFASNFLDRL